MEFIPSLGGWQLAPRDGHILQNNTPPKMEWQRPQPASVLLFANRDQMYEFVIPLCSSWEPDMAWSSLFQRWGPEVERAWSLALGHTANRQWTQFENQGFPTSHLTALGPCWCNECDPQGHLLFHSSCKNVSQYWQFSFILNYVYTGQHV